MLASWQTKFRAIYGDSKLCATFCQLSDLTPCTASTLQNKRKAEAADDAEDGQPAKKAKTLEETVTNLAHLTYDQQLEHKKGCVRCLRIIHVGEGWDRGSARKQATSTPHTGTSSRS